MNRVPLIWRSLAFAGVVVMSSSLLFLFSCTKIPDTPAFKVLSSTCSGRDIHWEVKCYTRGGYCAANAWIGDSSKYSFHPEEWAEEGQTPDEAAAKLAVSLNHIGHRYSVVPEFDSGVQECTRPKNVAPVEQ